MNHRTILGLLVLVILTACGGSAASQTSGDTGAAGGTTNLDGAAAVASTAAMPAAGNAESGGAANKPIEAAQNAQAQRERLVIKTADVQILVQAIDQAEAQIRTIAAERNGFVLSSQSSGEAEQRTASVSIKVPVDRFDDAIGAVGQLAIEIESQRVQGQDVTDEFVDLESQLRNLRAVEARLLQFLNDAERVQDLLSINQELSNVQSQIEQAEGRRQYLQQSAALSTINVTLRAQPVVVVGPEAGWSPSAVARSATNSLIGLGQAVANVLIVAAVWVPVWLPLILLGLWLRRRGRPAPPTAPSAS